MTNTSVKKYPKYKDSGIPWIGEIPEEWRLIRLQFCLDEIKEQNDPIKSKQVLSLVKDKGVMLYEEKGNLGNVAKEDISEYKLAYPNNLILNSMNILIGSVGISKYFGCVSPVYYVFKETDQSDLRFINYIFTTKEFQKELRRYANGIMEIRLRVSAQDIIKRKIAFPPKKEQQKISDYLDEKCETIDQVIETEEKIIEKLKEYKQSIITKVVTKGLNKLASMKDSGVAWIGKIPQHWEIKRLKYIAISFAKGKGITKEEVVMDGTVSCVRYGEIYSKYNNKFDSCFSKTKEEFLATPQYFSYGDILFAGTGELIEEIGKNIVYVGKEQCLAGGDIIVMRHQENPIFLNYALDSSYSQAQKSYGKIKLKVVHISESSVGNILVALPTREEQNSIANYLDEKCSKIDKAISKKEQVIEKLTEYKKSLIYECVTGKRMVA